MDLMLNTALFSLDKYKVYEAAHNRGIEIVSFGTNTDLRRVNSLAFTEVLERTNEEYAKAIHNIASARPNAPIVVWYNRAEHSQPIGQKLTTNPQFQPLGRDVKKMGVVGSVFDTLRPLSANLSRPVSLDLSKKSLANVGLRHLATIPISSTTSYKDCLRVMNDRLGKRYDYIVVFSNDEN